MPLYTPYDRYRVWNKALLNYYFDENDTQQIILCIDVNLIEEIGTNTREIREDLREGQTYLDHFLQYTCPKAGDRQGFPVSNKRSLNVLINEMIEYSSATIHFFGFTVMLVYLYATEGTETAIRRKTLELSGDSFTRFECIVEMWDILGKRYKRFGSDRLAGNQPYVGRLKFHTVLRKRFKDEFLSLLTENNLKWNEQEESFEQFINYKVGPLLLGNRDLLGAVRPHINNPDTLFYFESLVRNCDYSHNTNLTHRYNRSLLFAYNHKKNQLYLKIEGEDSAYLYADNKSLKTYLVEDIFYVDRPSVDYKRYDNLTLDLPNGDKNVLYSTTKRSYHLLKKVDDNIFEEVMEAEEGYCYLFVTSSRSDLDLISNQTTKDITDKVSAFGQGVQIMLIRSWHGRQNLEQQNEARILTSSYPKLRGGIRSTTEPRAYIPSALPIIEFEDEEHAKNIEVKCKQYPVLSPNIEISQEISGKYIHLILTGNSSATKTEWEICIKEHEQGKTLLSRNIQIHHLSPEIPAPIYGIDRYGIERHAKDLPAIPHSTRTNGQQLQTGNKESTNTSPLLDILIQLSNNGVVSQEHLKKAISYTLKIKGSETNSYNRWKVIADLSDLGYIIGYKNNVTGRYENQLCQPKLHRTQIRINQRYNTNAYILTGCYTESLLDSLKQNIEDVRVTIEQKSVSQEPQIDTSCIQYRAISECIPDVVLVQPAEIKAFSAKRCIEMIDHPYAFDMIQYAATINDCINKYLLDNNDRREYNGPLKAPQILHGDNFKTLIWQKTPNEVYQTDHYIDTEDHNMRKEVPEEFMKNYIQLKKGKAVAILEPNATDTTNLRQDHNFKSITFTSHMGVPKILRRSLCELNQGCPIKRKCFIVNAVESNITSDYIYTECDTYSIKAKATDIVKILSGKEITEWNDTTQVFITRIIKDTQIEISCSSIESDWYILKLTIRCSCIKIFFKFGQGENNDTCVIQNNGKTELTNVNRKNFNEFVSKLILAEDINDYITEDYNQDLIKSEGKFEEMVIFYRR